MMTGLLLAQQLNEELEMLLLVQTAVASSLP